MEFNIALLKGDGIGPEIVESTVRVLEKTADKFGHKFNFTPYLIGGCAIDAAGIPLPQEHSYRWKSSFRSSFILLSGTLHR